MAASFNKVILLGNLTRDPELRTTAGGLTICKFSMACNRSYKAQDGSQKEEVTYIEVDAFGRQGELIGKSLTKGNPIFLEGRLKLDQWESNTGEKRSKLSVVMENFQFVGSKKFAEEGAPSPYQASTPPERAYAYAPAAASKNAEIDEDVPF